MSPLGFVRLRRQLLVLLLVGGVMTMAPASAVPFAGRSASGDAGAQASTSDDAGPVGRAAVATGGLNDANSLGGDMTGEDLLGDLPAGNPGGNPDGALPGLLPGGGSPGGALPGDGSRGGSVPGVRTGDLLGGGNPGGGNPGGNPGSDPGNSGPRIHFGGLHIGRNGPLFPALPALPALPAVPALPSRPALPGIPAAGNPPALPGTSTGNPSGPGTDSLPASLDRVIPGRPVSDPSTTAGGAEGETPAVTTPTGIHATPSAGTSLPRTGPGELSRGPVALALLGASAAARAAARRRRSDPC